MWLGILLPCAIPLCNIHQVMSLHVTVPNAVLNADSGI